MKLGMIMGFALGATATAVVVSNMNISKIARKTKKAVMHTIENMTK